MAVDVMLRVCVSVRVQEWGMDLGEGVDIPDEFLDPLTCTLMTDPVLLPGSGQVIDRSVIERHLASQKDDPFSRTPLTADMLVPDRALRARIEAWRASQSREASKLTKRSVSTSTSTVLHCSSGVQ